jgi:threonine dehydrogenase-like Zn-dependent dehydrogenase
MRALCWHGTNTLRVGNVADPTILNAHDAVVRVIYSSVCGSDEHIITGYLPGMKRGDIIGHEFLGEVVEVGPAVTKIKVGDRVCVSPFHKCGACFHCERDETSLCDNSNPKPHLAEPLYGQAIGGIYGYTHTLGGYAGCHAEYVRVPYADNDCFVVPESLSNEQAIFCSEAFPTGYHGADIADIQPGDTVAVWGCGGVGLMAQVSAFLLGAGRVIAIDRIPERLRMAREQVGCETINYEDVSVLEALKEMTGGRGPDRCIEAVGMESHGDTPDYAADRFKQAIRIGTDSAHSLREAIMACRKGGTVSVMGVFAYTDKFPMGAVLNKSLTIKSGQVYGTKYIPQLLERVSRGEADPSFMITHKSPLEKAPEAYDMWRFKEDGCVRVIFDPSMR